MHYVYSLKCKKGHCVGCTNNLKERLNRHKSGQVNATKNILPIKLVFYIAFKNKYKALDFERFNLDKIISISSVPDYNEDARQKGVTKTVFKDYRKLDEFSDKVMNEIKMILS